MDPIRKPEIRKTRDGSDTLYSVEAGQYYHNPNGAVEESRHVFLRHGGVLKALDEGAPVHVFETGFGTGLNLLLLDDALASHPTHAAPVRFTSMEAFPISAETARTLNYGRFLAYPSRMDALADGFAGLKPGWNEVPWPTRINVHVGVMRAGPGVGAMTGTPFTHVFHDPFSIEVSPELWSVAMFTWLRSVAAADALLSTYAAATKARAAMAAAGWFVARAPGALGKREMTLASPTADRLLGYARVDETRLVSRLMNGEFDAPS